MKISTASLKITEAFLFFSFSNLGQTVFAVQVSHLHEHDITVLSCHPV